MGHTCGDKTGTVVAEWMAVHVCCFIGWRMASLKLYQGVVSYWIILFFSKLLIYLDDLSFSVYIFNDDIFMGSSYVSSLMDSFPREAASQTAAYFSLSS